MTHRPVVVNGVQWELAPEDQRLAGRLLRAIIEGRVLDELTGTAPDTQVTISSQWPGLISRTAAGGLVGLVGFPSETLPRLATDDYPSVDWRIDAPGYVPVSGTVQFLHDAAFPGQFAAASIGDISLHHVPVVIAGRITKRTSAGVEPVDHAIVSITEIWKQRPPADGSVPSSPPNFVSLRPPLYAPRPATSGQLRRHNLTPVTTEDKTLRADAEAGSVAFDISNPVGLLAGSVVIIDADPAIQEFTTVQTVVPVGAPDLPAHITITPPLAYRHRSGALVRRATLQAPGAQRTITAAASAGDSVAFLNGLGGLATAETVELSGGGPPPQFHEIHEFAVHSDADGRYQLPPLSRVAQLTVRAKKGTATVDVPFVPDYTRGENQLDIGF